MRTWRLSRITRFLVIRGRGAVWKGASLDDYSLHTINGLCPEPIIYDIVADGKPLSLEVDTGARLSIISHDTDMKLWYCQPPTLHPSKDWLRTSTGEVIQVEGIVDVVVQDRNRVMHTLPLVVVPDSRHSLLGLNWLTKGPVDWSDTHACKHTEPHSSLNHNLKKHPAILEDSKEIPKTGMAVICRWWAFTMVLQVQKLTIYYGDLAGADPDRLLVEDIIEPV